jgi:nucleotide-binding universal stress UspA family protein
MPAPEVTAAGPIVLALDPGDPSEDAETLALALARAYGAEVILATVFPIIRFRSRLHARHYERALRDEADRFLDGRLERWRARGTGVAARTMATGSPSAARGLHTLARQAGATLVVLGPSRRHGAGHRLPGPMAMRFAHGAPCPVAVAVHSPAERLARIGVAFAPSADGRAALLAGAELAERCDASLRVISVTGPLPWMDVTEPRFDGLTLSELYAGHLAFELEAALAELPADLVVEADMPAGDPVEVLGDASAELDVLVCGSRGHGPVGEVLLGATSAGLLGAARCPLLIVPRAVEARPGPPSG